MIACSQPLAAEAGLEILRNGGNAGKSPLTRPDTDIPNEP